jgi:hypothetical protein
MKLDFPRALAGLACVASVALIGCVDRGTSDDFGDDTAGTSDVDADAPGSADGRNDDDAPDAPSDPSGGGPPPTDPPRACTDACEAYVQCFPDDEYTLETCVQECAVGLQHEESLECRAALVDLLECYTGLDCDAWFEDDACLAEQEVLEDACDGDSVCTVGIGGDGHGSCGAMHSCPGEPEYAIDCDETECRCYEDDEDVGGCASQGVCMEGGGDILEHAEACCGWSVF